MSLLTQAYLLERYGPRLSLDDLVETLDVAKNTIYNQRAQKAFPVKTYIEGNKVYADYDDCVAAQRNGTSYTPCYGADGDAVLNGFGDQFLDFHAGGWAVILIAMAVAFTCFVHLSVRASVL